MSSAKIRDPVPRIDCKLPLNRSVARLKVRKRESTKSTTSRVIELTISGTESLANDIEYRINQLIEEAARFMQHRRRTIMTTAHIDQALRVLNIEPLYGHSPYNPTTFRRALHFPQVSAAGPVYFVEDEEIDFGPVEGVQPLIPENPPTIPRDTDVDPTAKSDPLKLNGLTPAVNGVVNGLGLPSTTNGPPGTKKPAQSQQLVKQVLSRELQLYYVRLTSSLLPPPSDMPKRTAALASLRDDAGLQALLPYLVRLVAEGVVNALKEDSRVESEGK
ncbi:hypothetical protein BYT27DRAFT_7341252 [Phlegmacium glaucopus]|nr:hypothetical protein BYT27DRAFT_7341252 [Phlegmacium glaucopus]